MLDLPMRLDRALDNIGVGAMLKNLGDDRRALIIDFHPATGMPMVVQAKDRKRDKVPTKPRHYELRPIKEPRDWVVLTEGHDELLAQ